jgi:glutamate-ammonia-ligase adenylyltransferase
LRAHTAEALAAMAEAGLADAKAVAALSAAWRLQQDLSQLLKLALEEDADPGGEPKGFRDLLARAGGVRRFQDLSARLAAVRADAMRAFDRLVAAA